MKLNLRIRTRLTLAYTSIAFLLLCGLGVALYVALSLQLNEAADAELSHSAESIAAFMQRQDQHRHLDQLPQELREHSEFHSQDELIQIKSSDGAWIYRSPGAENLDIGTGARPGVSTLHAGKRTYRVLRRDMDLPGGRYQLGLATNRSEYAEALENLASLLFLGIPLSMIVAFLAGLWMSGRVLRPIKRITDTLGEINARKLNVRLPLTQSGDELDALSATVNGMLDRLQIAFDRIGRFTADASHELRTPLALIRGNAEIMRSEASLPHPVDVRSLEIIAEADYMQSLIEDLLELARYDGTSRRAHEIVDPADLAMRAALVGERLAAAKQIHFTAQSPKAIFPLFGNDRDLSRVLVILLDNAIRCTPAGGKVSLAVTSSATECEIQVADTGCGIDSRHLASIFDRFYRVDDSRTRATGGTGLGLSIAQAIVAAHGGVITVQSTLGEGSVFTVRIPSHTPSAF
jgi:signal transduction histidine kinase